MEFDVVIVGGGFAGQAAALHLARARRRVLVVDAGRPRNRFARSSHGFLGQDGRPPPEIIGAAYRQLAAYPTVSTLNDEAVDAETVDDGFCLSTKGGTRVTGKCLILASGVRDLLPEIPGLEARWGQSVLHCPYCHGYELNERPIGVLATGPWAFHVAMLVRDWGPTTLFTQGAFVPTAEQTEALDKRDVRIETAPVAELLGPAPALEAARLTDGRAIEIAGLFVTPRTVPASDLAERLGCSFQDGPTGPFVSVDAGHQTSVPGAFAAGDAAAEAGNATLAAAAGVRAASGAHRLLIFGAETV